MSSKDKKKDEKKKDDKKKDDKKKDDKKKDDKKKDDKKKEEEEVFAADFVKVWKKRKQLPFFGLTFCCRRRMTSPSIDSSCFPQWHKKRENSNGEATWTPGKTVMSCSTAITWFISSQADTEPPAILTNPSELFVWNRLDGMESKSLRKKSFQEAWFLKWTTMLQLWHCP